MDINEIIEQVTAKLGDSPEMLGELVEKPKEVIEGIIGDKLDGVDVQAIIEGVMGKAGEAGIDLQGIESSVVEGLKGLVGEDSPIHGILGGLFNK